MKSKRLYIVVCLFALIGLSQCKARKDFGSQLSSDDRVYNSNKYTNVIQELFKGMRYAGDAVVAQSPNGEILATSGSLMRVRSGTQNDIKDQEFVQNYASGGVSQGGITSVYLWNAKTLQPYSDGLNKKLEGFDIEGIKQIVFTSDSKGLAVCGDTGVAFWPNHQDRESPIFWKASTLGGRCMSIGFGRLRQNDVLGKENLAYDVLAIGTDKGLIRYLHTREKPNPEVICTLGKPIRALQFLGNVQTSDGVNAPDATQLLITVGTSALRSRMNLLENRTRSVEGKYAVLPFLTMPAIGRLNGPGLRLGNTSRSSSSNNRSRTASCNSLLTGEFDSAFKNPTAISFDGRNIAITSIDNRYMTFFEQAGNRIRPKKMARKRFQVNALRKGGVKTLATSGSYGAISGPLFFTGGSDRSARLWKYNADGTRDLDLIGQINLGSANYVTSAVFLKNRPAVVFGDRGGVYVWDFGKAMVPSAISQLPKADYTAVSIDDRYNQVYLGTADGKVSVYDYSTGAAVAKADLIGKVFDGNSGISDIIHSADMKSALVTSGAQAKMMFTGDSPDVGDDLNLWDARSSVVGFKFGSDGQTVFSAAANGTIRVANPKTGDKKEYTVKAAANDPVIGFTVYPMNIKYQKLTQEASPQNQSQLSVEMHPILRGLVDANYVENLGQYSVNAFQIFGEKKKAKIDEITGNNKGIEPAPSKEDSDIIAGANLTPQEASDQIQSDAKGVSENANPTAEQTNNPDQKVDALRQMMTSMFIKAKVENVQVKHLKVAVLLKSGKIIMSDLIDQKEWELKYRTQPVLPFSGFFQQIFLPQAEVGRTSGSYLTSQINYSARQITFDDDGGCLMLLNRSGSQIRCLPILQSSGTNAKAITQLSSQPKRDFFDPWIVFNAIGRRFSSFKFAQYYSLAAVADTVGGLTVFDLNRFSMTAYSKRMPALGYIKTATRGSPVVKFSTSVSGDFAVAIHKDKTVRVHWLDRAFELSMLDVSNEDLDELRDFAQ